MEYKNNFFLPNSPYMVKYDANAKYFLIFFKKKCKFWFFPFFTISRQRLVKVHFSLYEHNFHESIECTCTYFLLQDIFYIMKELTCVVKFWDMATLRRTSTQKGIKWNVKLPQIFPLKNTPLDLKFSKHKSFFKEIGQNMVVLIILWSTHHYNKIKIVGTFFKKIFQSFICYILLHVILDFGNIPMKNICSRAIYSLEIKKLKFVPNLKKWPHLSHYWSYS